METLRSILNLIERNCYMASLDLKDAYYSVPISLEYRKFLPFCWKGVLYQFTCLPNGLSSCPRLFTKLLKPPLSQLRRLGHIIASYIDDLYLQGKTYEECVTSVIASLQKFDELGFIIHPEKSVFNPSQTITLLGFIINSVKMTITLTDEKRAEIKKICNAILASDNVKIRDLAQLIGKLIASFPGVMHGPLFYRSLEADKTKALRISKGNFDDNMCLSEDSRREIRWWMVNIPHVYNVISHGLPSFTLTTDASLSGWGAVFHNKRTGGTWSEIEKNNHINYLELLALFLGLQTYCKSLNDTHIRVRLDNTTAVAVINHMGTSHSSQCNTLGKAIWEWCIQRHIWLSAAHLPGIENTEADFESRKKQSNTEWMLNHKRLHEALLKLNFAPDIDVFASRLNTQFPSYISYRPDPGAKAVDVFSFDLSDVKFYAFPPFSVISPFLQKIAEEAATGVCVLPNWPTQSWYSKAMKMCIRDPVHLQPERRLLRLADQEEAIHPLHNTLSLLVCLLSGKN